MKRMSLKRPLVLARQTVRALSTDELRHVGGAIEVTRTGCPPYSTVCPRQTSNCPSAYYCPTLLDGNCDRTLLPL
jgi:hypothetical protein